MPAHGCLLAGLDERRGAKIDRADVGENADCRNHCRSQEPNDHDLQMRAAVRAVHRMIHGILPGLRRSVAAAGVKGCVAPVKYVRALALETHFTEP